MSTKRYQVMMTPYIGLNGKLAQASVICENLPDSNRTGRKFFYGNNRPRQGKTYFAIREASRNLKTNPISTSETTIREYFTQSSTVYAEQLAPTKARYEEAKALFDAAGGENFRAWCIGKCIKSAVATTGTDYLNWLPTV